MKTCNLFQINYLLKRTNFNRKILLLLTEIKIGALILKFFSLIFLYFNRNQTGVKDIKNIIIRIIKCMIL